RTDTGTNITTPTDLAVSGTSTAPLTASNVCTYSSAGTYTTKVIIERGLAPPAPAQTTITGSTPPRTSAPPTPTGLSAGTVTVSSVALSWTASTDNVGIAGYKIFRCTGTSCTVAQVATSTGTGTTFTNTGLAAATTYAYRVAAYDAAGNTSAQSSL